MKKRRSFFDPFSSDDTSLVNLTPLIDVVFVVLIVFILIAPLTNIDRVDLASGKSSSFTPHSYQNKIAIYVHRDNLICLGHEPIAATELKNRLIEVKKRCPQKTVVELFHDKNAFFGTYETVKTSVEAAGFASMDVILQ